MAIIKFKKFLLYLIFFFCIPSSTIAGNLTLKSFGHSSFLIDGDEKSILINPFKSIGCTSNLDEPKGVNPNFILASSKLADEGYNPDNKLLFVEPGIYKYENIVLNGVTVPHDRLGGRRFGMATVWSWEQNNLKIVHMGGAAGEMDINSQIILARPDILFISIGGGIKSYDGKEAAKIVKTLKPALVVPVHFVNGDEENADCDLSNADLFLENMKEYKIKYVGNIFEINPKNIEKNSIYIFKN